MWSTKLIRLLADTAVLLIAGAMLAGWLLRVAPGATVDVREADPRFSRETLDRLKADRDAGRAATARSFSWFASAIRGDLGTSEITGEPVAATLAERVPATLTTVLIGSAAAFLIGVAGAAASSLGKVRMFRLLATGTSFSVLAVPSGLLALAAVFLRLPVEVAVAIAVVPRTYLYAVELFETRRQTGWLLSAQAAGISSFRIFIRHLLPSVSAELGAVAGLAVIGALAVTIPAEVLTGRSGLGQLAWQSAVERDLPVVIAVTLVMVVIARSVTLLSALPERKERPAG